MKKLLFAVLFSLCLLTGQALAQPCSCEPDTDITQSFADADLVFEGKVVFVNTNWMSGGLKYSFEVNRTWKRPAAKYLIVNAPWEKDCGYPFKADSTYLVFVKKKFGLKTDGCMGNTLISHISGEVPFAQDAFPPQNSTADTSFLAYTLGFAVLLSFLFIAMVVFRKKWYKPPQP
ncbi:MAG: hypothetical protein R3D00_07360 [Bacteroidia bacterium]